MSSPYNHYVSKFYLNGFVSDNGQVAVYKKNTPTSYSLIKFCSTRDICGKYNFFMFDGVEDFLKSKNLTEYEIDGIKLTEGLLEKELSKLENLVSVILKKLRLSESLKAIDANEAVLLLEWIAWIYIANPKTKSFFI